ncbi:hypothetical protein O9929_11265 [Vibrio lentus]|nr:hypothetical protein [Vibrio lentus]
MKKRGDYPAKAKLLFKSGRYTEAIKNTKSFSRNGMPSAALELEYLLATRLT